MSKVYCNNCKHEHYADCRKWAYEQDTPYRRITWYKSCAIKNKSNDCQDYEPKLFLAIKRKLLDQVDKLAKGLRGGRKMKKASELFKVCPRCDGEGKIKYMGDKPSPYDLSVSDDTWRKKINEAPLVACAKCEGLGFVNKESE